jgi:hypothetical protein
MEQIKEIKWFIEKVGETVIRYSKNMAEPVQVRVYNEEHAKWLYDTQFDGDTYDYTKTGVNSILKWE